MSCSTVRRTLLGRETPAPAPDEARHLLRCPACRAWHRRLVQLERQIPLLPVPAPPVPPRLLAALHEAPSPATSRGLARPRNLESGRKKLALAFSLAASLAAFVVGWSAWPDPPLTPRPVRRAPDPYVALRDGRLARASTAPQRAAVLADLASEFLAEVRQKPDDAARVTLLARQFDRLVREDLIHHVGLVPRAERRAVASSMALRLSQIQSEAARLASEWGTHHGTASAPLRRMAEAARSAEEQLRRFA